MKTSFAWTLAPKPSKPNMGLIGRLYAVERRMRELPPEGRYRVRQDIAKPLRPGP